MEFGSPTTRGWWGLRVAWLPLVLFSTFASGQESRLLAPTGPQDQVQEKTPNVEVGPVPTPPHIVDLMLALADVKESDVVYDLGCGDGRIVVAAAEKYGCKAVGFDIDPACVREARANVANSNLEDLVTIEERDIFDLDLSEADVVTLFLLFSLNERLLPQLEKMKPGSRIVSHAFDIPGVEPDIELQCNSHVHGLRDKVYLWTTPLNRIAESTDAVEFRPLERAASPFLEHTYQRVFFSWIILAIVGAGLIWLVQKVLNRRLVLKLEKRPSE